MKLRRIILIFIANVFILVGCQEQKSTEPPISEVLPDLEVQEPVLSEQQEPEQQESEQQEPIIEPGVIHLVDPDTSEIVYTFSTLDLGYGENVETYKENIEQLAKELARGTVNKKGYDRRMVLDRISTNGQIIKGSPMVVLRESELVEKILVISAVGGIVELPVYTIESGYDTEDVTALDDVVVASYTTYFSASDAGRNRNIELSAQAIDNIIIGSGDYFSFNTMVGPRDEASGYQPAPEIINKRLVMGIGGGICQTSSTLFNAVDQLPIHIVERHHHSLDVGYVPVGRDATVSYGSLDFRFQNVSAVPFLIKAVYGKNFLKVEIRTASKYEGHL